MVDRRRRHVISDVLQVFTNRVVRVLQRDDMDGIGSEILGDLDTLLRELEVEVLDVLDRLLIQLDCLGEDVPAEGLAKLLAQQPEQLVGLQLQQLVGPWDRLLLSLWWGWLLTPLGCDVRAVFFMAGHVSKGAKADATG